MKTILNFEGNQVSVELRKNAMFIHVKCSCQNVCDKIEERISIRMEGMTNCRSVKGKGGRI